jgi:tRNA dimethylallyltransferase
LSKKIILVAGPTASGKSDLSILLAKKINGEIINADSMQVYKEFSILSSRPNKKNLKKIKHHLYGVIPVKKYFSTGAWLRQVKKEINGCIKRKKIPILTGGTGLYFNAITKGISKIPTIDPNKRNKIRQLHKEIGQKEFYKKLVKLDPIVKKNILPLDSQRTIRAFEVKLETGKSLYEWATNTKSDFSNFIIKKIFLNIPRDYLIKKIKKRTDIMFRNGCVDEVKSFLKLDVDKDASVNKLIGVREIKDYLDGLISLDQVKELINIKTRQYAKSQNTWSRGHMKNWNMFYSKDMSILVKKTLKVIS